MSQSTLISIVLGVIIIAIFLIDFFKKRKENSLEKSVEKFVEKESVNKERSSVLNWILKRKKNITFFVILVSTAKLFLNYFVYPIYLKLKRPDYGSSNSISFDIHDFDGKSKLITAENDKKAEEFFLESLESYDIVILKNKENVFRGVYHNVDKLSFKSLRADFSVHLENIFSYDLFLFLPCSIFFLILVWIFNDKIKAQ